MPLTLVEYSYVCSIAMKVNLLYLSPRVRALWQHRTPSLISSNLRTGWSEPSGPCLQRGIAIGHLILSRAVETTTAFDYERPVQCQCIYALCMLIKWQHSYFLLLFLDRTLYHIQSNMLILLISMWKNSDWDAYQPDPDKHKFKSIWCQHKKIYTTVSWIWRRTAEDKPRGVLRTICVRRFSAAKVSFTNMESHTNTTFILAREIVAQPERYY